MSALIVGHGQQGGLDRVKRLLPTAAVGVVAQLGDIQHFPLAARVVGRAGVPRRRAKTARGQTVGEEGDAERENEPTRGRRFHKKSLSTCGEYAIMLWEWLPGWKHRATPERQRPLSTEPARRQSKVARMTSLLSSASPVVRQVDNVWFRRRACTPCAIGTYPIFAACKHAG